MIREIAYVLCYCKVDTMIKYELGMVQRRYLATPQIELVVTA